MIHLSLLRPVFEDMNDNGVFLCFSRAVYGTNEILIPQRSLPVLFIVEILNPFFVFQFFSFTVWCLDDYFLYATAVMIMSLISITGAGLSAYFVSIRINFA